jgi:chromosome segregation ATPase
MYRFLVKAEPGKPAVLSVEEERTDQQQWAVTNLDNGTIAFYANTQVTTPKVKAALDDIIKRKEAIEQLARQRQQLEQQVRVIDQDQSRIRQNMHELDHTLKIYADYVDKFGKQEAQIESLHKQIESLQNEENGARKSLDDYLLGLDLS